MVWPFFLLCFFGLEPWTPILIRRRRSRRLRGFQGSSPCWSTKNKAGRVACFIFGLHSGTRTGRRSAERKKAAGGRLFSPRVESLCTAVVPGMCMERKQNISNQAVWPALFLACTAGREQHIALILYFVKLFKLSSCLFCRSLVSYIQSTLTHYMNEKERG